MQVRHAVVKPSHWYNVTGPARPGRRGLLRRLDPLDSGRKSPTTWVPQVSVCADCYSLLNKAGQLMVHQIQGWLMAATGRPSL